MKVYRVEHQASGEGPYVHGGDTDGTGRWLNRMLSHHAGPRWPTPRYEGIPVMPTDLFGFWSMEQLTDWFNLDELVELSLLDFRVTTYDVPSDRVVFGTKQVVFRPS